MDVFVYQNFGFFIILTTDGHSLFPGKLIHINITIDCILFKFIYVFFQEIICNFEFEISHLYNMLNADEQ